MLDLINSKLYAKSAEVEFIKNEPDYVQNRYYAIIKTTIEAPFRWTRQQAADILDISKRHMQRLVRAYRMLGIPGLRFKSKRPKTMPNKSPKWMENTVVKMKKLTGFGKTSISTLVNEQFRLEGCQQKVGASLVSRIFLRNNLQKPPIIKQTVFKSFDWKRPNNLLQSDLTQFNGVPILAMEDDHSRFAWSDTTDDESAETVVRKMHELVPFKFNNLLTDNGPQFSKKNPFLGAYRKKHVLKEHIHASAYHPETLGKISRYQCGLKDFLRYKLGDSCTRLLIRPLIKAYNLFYNNGRRNRITKGIPSEIYSGKKDKNWFGKMMRILKSGHNGPHFTNG